jgi:DNA-binding NarL/FixJ family response regulator
LPTGCFAHSTRSTPASGSTSTRSAAKWPSPIKEGDRLTGRQREVLQLLAEGKSMKEAAYTLNLTADTVADHKYRIMEILNVKNNAELVKYAIRNHIIAA